MQLNDPDTIIRKADALVRSAGTREPLALAAELGITVYYPPFATQKGVYTIIKRNPYIFLKQDLDPVMRDIVILHEIGHHLLHKKRARIFQEFSLFDMTSSAMEYEANLFAAHIALPDDEILDYIYEGYSADQISAAMHSDINLVAIKVSDLSRRGHAFRVPEHKNNFL